MFVGRLTRTLALELVSCAVLNSRAREFFGGNPEPRGGAEETPLDSRTIFQSNLGHEVICFFFFYNETAQVGIFRFFRYASLTSKMVTS